RLFTSNARALDQLLHDLAVLFTYDETLRSALPGIWRQVMTTALDAVDAGVDLLGDRHWPRAQALAGLLPVPRLDLGDTDPDGTLERAWKNWVAPDEIADLVARWMTIARRVPEAADAVGKLARCATPAWQATTGLVWVEELIGDDYAAVAGTSWLLLDWLGAVRASGRLDPDGA